MPNGKNKAGEEKLGVLGWGVQLKTRDSGKDPCWSARLVCRDRKVGKVIMPTMRAGSPSLCVPQSFPLIPHPKAASLARMHPSCCLISCRLSRLYLHLLPEPAQSCPPSSPGPLLLPLLMPPTHIHTPPRQSFTPCFTPPAQFRTSCHLPGANSPPSDSLHQEKKTSLVGARLGCS